MNMTIKAFLSEENPEYKKHKEILFFCNKMNVSLPQETSDFFGNDSSESYVIENYLEQKLTEGVHYEEFSEDMTEGFYVNLTRLPRNVTKLKFTISY